MIIICIINSFIVLIVKLYPPQQKKKERIGFTRQSVFSVFGMCIATQVATENSKAPQETGYCTDANT